MANETKVSVGAVMTLPRYGPTTQFMAMQRACRKVGIGVDYSEGCFWDHGIDGVLQSACQGDYDWFFTFDYDVLFTAEHLMHMLNKMAQVKDYCHALAPMQARRDQPVALGDAGGNVRPNQDGIMQVHTSHFGMTLFQAEAFKKLALPWFHSSPDKNGHWQDEYSRTDPDIWFWKQWEKCGNTAYVDPGCQTGHIEEMVSVWDGQKKVYMTISEWFDRTEPGRRIRN